MTLGPGGAKVILLKSKCPSIIECTEIFGLHIEVLSMFKVVCAFPSGLYHRFIGNSLEEIIFPCPDIYLCRVSFVCVRWCQLVVYLFLSVKYINVSQALFSSQWVLG